MKSLTALAAAGLAGLVLLLGPGRPGPPEHAGEAVLPAGPAVAQAAGSRRDPWAVRIPSPPRRAKPDPLAPPGAPVDWLPEEEWVQERWLPYDQRRFWRVLHTDGEEVRRWLLARPLADLARAKRIKPSTALRRIMRPVRREIRGAAYRKLVERARRTFTQRHLSQHLFGHTLHMRTYSRGVPRVLGIWWPEIVALQRQGLKLRDIAERQGLTAEEVVRRVGVYLTATARRGVRRKATPRRQAAFWLREEKRYLALVWLGPPRDRR